MEPQLTPFAQSAACIYLVAATGCVAAGVSLTFAHAPAVRPWRVHISLLVCALLACLLGTFALLHFDPAYAALPEKLRASFELLISTESFFSIATGFLAIGGLVLWGPAVPRVLPWTFARRRAGSLRDLVRAVPWAWILGAVTLVAGLTILLFRLIEVRVPRDALPLSDLLDRSPVAALLLMIPAVVSEEVLFRLFLQGAIRRTLIAVDPGAWSAVVIPAVIWALGHAGQVEPDLPRLTQMFCFGLVQGITMERHGLEAALAVHLLFNLTTLLPIYPI